VRAAFSGLAFLGLALLMACSGDGVGHDVPSHGTIDRASVQGLPSGRHEGPQGRVGQFVAECAFSHSAPDDPIVHPGRPGMSHLHDFFGSRAVSASSTAEDLLDSETTCDLSADTASYWAPAVMLDGRQITPVSMTAYYRAALDVDPSSVVAFPVGLAMIGGDQAAIEPQSLDVVGWSCGGSSSRHVDPPTCSAEATLRLDVTFPDCWDGERLDSAGHRRHVHYSFEGTCPSSHPVPMPQLTVSVNYPLFGDVERLRLASGSPRTTHADFLNAWDPVRLETEVALCIRGGVVCGISDGRVDD
jgi:hypothetical protein